MGNIFMMKSLVFLVEEAVEGGYNARAENESIFTQADTIQELSESIAEAIACHFDDEILREFILKSTDKRW